MFSTFTGALSLRYPQNMPARLRGTLTIAPLLSLKKYSLGTSLRLGISSGVSGSSHSSLIIVTYTGFQQATMSYLGLGHAALIFGSTVPAPPACRSQVMSTSLSAALILRVASISGPPQSMPVSATAWARLGMLAPAINAALLAIKLRRVNLLMIATSSSWLPRGLIGPS